MLTVQSVPTVRQASLSAGDRAPIVRPRSVAFDRVRVLLAILVVAHHAGQPYGPTGGAWPLFDAQRAAILGSFFAVNAAFFMGLFFFISGALLPGAYDRRGAAVFLRERAWRLGLPLLVFALGIFPPIIALTSGQSPARWLSDPVAYLGAIEPGHLWFLGHLLIYALVYALWRRWRPWLALDRLGAAWSPGHRALLGLVVWLAVTSFLVRLWWPIDRWLGLLWLTRVELAHLPQYLSLFVLGVLATRHGWLERLPAPVGRVWLGLGLTAALATYALGPARALGLAVPLAGGGLTPGSLIWSAWEAVICVGLSVGLLTLGRDRWTRPGRWLTWLAANTYGVYVVHLLLIVGLQFGLAGLSWPPLLKFGLVTVVGVPLSFLVSAGLRRWPPLGRLL